MKDKKRKDVPEILPIFAQCDLFFYKYYTGWSSVMKTHTMAGWGQTFHLQFQCKYDKKAIQTHCRIRKRNTGSKAELLDGKSPPSPMTCSQPYSSAADIWKYIHISQSHTSAHALAVLAAGQGDTHTYACLADLHLVACTHTGLYKCIHAL